MSNAEFFQVEFTLEKSTGGTIWTGEVEFLAPSVAAAHCVLGIADNKIGAQICENALRTHDKKKSQEFNIYVRLYAVGRVVLHQKTGFFYASDLANAKQVIEGAFTSTDVEVDNLTKHGPLGK